MRSVDRLVVLSLSLSIGAVPCLLRASEPAATDPPAAQEPAAKKRGPLITVSKETTRITSPLRDDGYVDYVAALNEISSKGVTPENNAVVPLWRAMGPGNISDEIRKDYFRQLGIPPLPKQGDYFVTFDDYLRNRGDDVTDQTDEQFDRSLREPWTEKDAPLVADWLKANEKPLRQITEASRRTRYYSPLIATDDTAPLISVLLPVCSQMRSAARVLTARAMFHLGQGKTDRAQQDLLACHRLGRLSGQGSILIDALISIAIDSMACRGDIALLRSGKLTAKQAREYRAELLRLAPSPQMVDKIDTGERFMFLDSVAGIARKGPRAIEQLANGIGNGDSKRTDKLLSWMAGIMVDWDEILRMGNSYYDRMVEGGRKPTRAERIKASDEMDKDIRQLAAALKDPKSIAKTLLSGKSPRQIATRQLGGLFVALLLPAVSAAIDAEYRGTMRMEVTQLAFALTAYHGDHDGYPAKLQQLVPKYAEALPKDAFSDGPLQYSRSDNGYLLYSIGRNGEDDGGRNRHHDPEAEDDPDYDGDDIAVRMPQQKR